jgi:hypothetical protein
MLYERGGNDMEDRSMKIMKQARWTMMALLLSVLSVTAAHAGVFISVTVAPPVLPVYEQPPCPEPDLIWTPGYWAYDYDAQSYYWVPGAWVPAPYEGALWTPPYWGWEQGVYAFHPGYWGPEVGYYGGVNYGFGYFGLGFVGGRWHERHFEYNEAVWHVNRTVVHTTYIDRTVIREHVIDERHVAYAGGPGGVRHDPTPDERRAMQVQHVAPTQYQQQHTQQARSERQNFFNVNHGRPQNVADARPLPAQHVAPPAARGGAEVNGGFRNGAQQPNSQAPQNHSVPAQRPMVGVPDQRDGRAERPVYPTPNGNQRQENRQPNQPQPQSERVPQYRPAPQQPQTEHMPQREPQQPQSERMPQHEQQPQYRPAPEPQRPQPMTQRPEPQYRPAPQPQSHPAPDARPAPAPRAEHESRPEPQHESRPAPEKEHDHRQ